MKSLALILAAVSLGAPFGSAEASAVSDEGGLTIEVVVEVDNGFTAVLVRPFSSFDELPPTAMNNRDDGTWGALVTLPTAEDWLISFEGIRETGETVRSDSAFLSELGVDPIVIGDPPSWARSPPWLLSPGGRSPRSPTPMPSTTPTTTRT